MCKIHLSAILLTVVMSLMATGAFASTSPKGIEAKVLDAVPRFSETLQGYDTAAEVTDRLSTMPMHAIEGVWRFAAEGTLMAVEREDDSELSGDDAGTVTYRMVIVRAADLSLRPGTVMGYLSPTAKRGVYDARIYTGRTDDGTKLYSPRTFTLTLSDNDSRMAINRYGTTFSFNWWRLLPYMYSRLISRREKKAGDINGCIRVYPMPAIPAEPRYL
ncbi:hypothetical protein [uncultured Duncaniella sp.]|jgi:hypothetical protein|nr:hypothetical protein [uncultured Duncaniella sp.]